MQQLLAYFSLLWSGKTTLKKIKGCISCTEEPLQINFALVSLKIQILCRCFLRVFLRTSVYLGKIAKFFPVDWCQDI